MLAAATHKFTFRIRTRAGWLLESLTVHGADQTHAERKLLQMYPGAEILNGEERAIDRRTQRLFRLHDLQRDTQASPSQ